MKPTDKQLFEVIAKNFNRSITKFTDDDSFEETVIETIAANTNCWLDSEKHKEIRKKAINTAALMVAIHTIAKIDGSLLSPVGVLLVDNPVDLYSHYTIMKVLPVIMEEISNK